MQVLILILVIYMAGVHIKKVSVRFIVTLQITKTEAPKRVSERD